MITLRKILLAGSFLLVGCGKNENLLTEENFTNVEWISAPFKGEVWSGYMGERIPHYSKNLRLYENMVAQRNGFRYIEKDNQRYIVGFKGKTILLPDLDNSGGVISGKDTVRRARNNGKENSLNDN